jgi:hypothetical protein
MPPFASTRMNWGGSRLSAGPTEVESPSAVSACERAPAIAGRSLDGEPLSLAGYRGRPVLVNV